MRIALHESLTLCDGDVALVLAGKARDAGFDEVEIVPFGGLIDLIDETAPSKGRVLDLLITPFILTGFTITEAIEEIRIDLPLIYSIVFEKNIDLAAEASEAGIDGFLAEPVSKARLERELERIFESIKRLHSASFVLNTSVGERRLAFHSVVCCETCGHDQVLTLEDGSSLTARYSSQALFDLLAKDGRFFKVGSSYIVNLNEVREINMANGMLTLTNGDKLNVPHRIRKPLERTLLEWQ